jgi:hypothetical protein
MNNDEIQKDKKDLENVSKSSVDSKNENSFNGIKSGYSYATSPILTYYISNEYYNSIRKIIVNYFKSSKFVGIDSLTKNNLSVNNYVYDKSPFTKPSFFWKSILFFLNFKYELKKNEKDLELIFPPFISSISCPNSSNFFSNFSSYSSVVSFGFSNVSSLIFKFLNNSASPSFSSPCSPSSSSSPSDSPNTNQDKPSLFHAFPNLSSSYSSFSVLVYSAKIKRKLENERIGREVLSAVPPSSSPVSSYFPNSGKVKQPSFFYFLLSLFSSLFSVSTQNPLFFDEASFLYPLLVYIKKKYDSLFFKLKQNNFFSNEKIPEYTKLSILKRKKQKRNQKYLISKDNEETGDNQKESYLDNNFQNDVNEDDKLLVESRNNDDLNTNFKVKTLKSGKINALPPKSQKPEPEIKSENLVCNNDLLATENNYTKNVVYSGISPTESPPFHENIITQSLQSTTPWHYLPSPQSLGISSHSPSFSKFGDDYSDPQHIRPIILNEFSDSPSCTVSSLSRNLEEFPSLPHSFAFLEHSPNIHIPAPISSGSLVDSSDYNTLISNIKLFHSKTDNIPQYNFRNYCFSNFFPKKWKSEDSKLENRSFYSFSTTNISSNYFSMSSLLSNGNYSNSLIENGDSLSSSLLPHKDVDVDFVKRNIPITSSQFSPLYFEKCDNELFWFDNDGPIHSFSSFSSSNYLNGEGYYANCDKLSNKNDEEIKENKFHNIFSMKNLLESVDREKSSALDMKSVDNNFINFQKVFSESITHNNDYAERKNMIKPNDQHHHNLSEFEETSTFCKDADCSFLTENNIDNDKVEIEKKTQDCEYYKFENDLENEENIEIKNEDKISSENSDYENEFDDSPERVDGDESNHDRSSDNLSKSIDNNENYSEIVLPSEFSINDGDDLLEKNNDILSRGDIIVDSDCNILENSPAVLNGMIKLENTENENNSISSISMVVNKKSPAIVRNLLRLKNGKIDLNYKYGKTCFFRFYFFLF